MDIQGKFGNDGKARAVFKDFVSYPVRLIVEDFGPDRDKVALSLTEGLAEQLRNSLSTALGVDNVEVGTLYKNARELLGTERGEDIEEYNPEYARAILELVGDLDPNATGATRARLREVAERLKLDMDKLY